MWIQSEFLLLWNRKYLNKVYKYAINTSLLTTQPQDTAKSIHPSFHFNAMVCHGKMRPSPPCVFCSLLVQTIQLMHVPISKWQKCIKKICTAKTAGYLNWIFQFQLPACVNTAAYYSPDFWSSLHEAVSDSSRVQSTIMQTDKRTKRRHAAHRVNPTVSQADSGLQPRVTPQHHLEVIVWLPCSGCWQRVGASPQLTYKGWRRALCVFSLICLSSSVSLAVSLLVRRLHLA